MRRDHDRRPRSPTAGLQHPRASRGRPARAGLSADRVAAPRARGTVRGRRPHLGRLHHPHAEPRHHLGLPQPRDARTPGPRPPRSPRPRSRPLRAPRPGRTRIPVLRTLRGGQGTAPRTARSSPPRAPGHVRIPRPLHPFRDRRDLPHLRPTGIRPAPERPCPPPGRARPQPRRSHPLPPLHAADPPPPTTRSRPTTSEPRRETGGAGPGGGWEIFQGRAQAQPSACCATASRAGPTSVVCNRRTASR